MIPRPANDNNDIQNGDTCEQITELLYRGSSLLSFTGNAVRNGLFTPEEKDYLDEIFGKFGEFDGEDRQKYSLLDIRRLSLAIIGKCDSRKAELKKILVSQNNNLSSFSEDDIYNTFKEILQQDISVYGIDAGIPKDQIGKLVGEITELALDIVSERRGKRA